MFLVLVVLRMKLEMRLNIDIGDYRVGLKLKTHWVVKNRLLTLSIWLYVFLKQMFLFASLMVNRHLVKESSSKGRFQK